MAVVTMVDASKKQGSFYAPQFQIRIEDVGLPRNVLRDVMQLTYKDNITEIDSFEITVNNWDADRRDFKYVGFDGPPRLLDKDNPASRADQIFDPRDKVVDIYLGYLDELKLMMKGHFTTLEPNFPTAGGPTLTVRGLNVLHKLRVTQYTDSWPDTTEPVTTDSQIAKDIASKKDKKTGRKRFPIPITIDENAAAKEPPLDFVAQQNQYDIDFLFQRARQRGYVVCVREAEPRTLYFGPSTGGVPGSHEDMFELRYPGSLIEFKPTLTTANQVKSVTVRGWNRKTKESINETVTLDDPKLNLNKDLHELVKKCEREERVVNEPIFTRRQARARATALLTERLKELVKCTGSTVGLPELRAGRRVRIKGVGPVFSGTYFVTETTHTIGANGYTTSFSARREDEGKEK
ncbi:MAG: phage late control D family protein [Vicinamibacterales bacterium]